MVFRNKISGSVVHVQKRDELNRLVHFQVPFGDKFVMEFRDFDSLFVGVPEGESRQALADAANEAYRERLANSPEQRVDSTTSQLDRIEANQAAIIDGLNRLGAFLKTDWRPIGEPEPSESFIERASRLRRERGNK